VAPLSRGCRYGCSSSSTTRCGTPRPTRTQSASRALRRSSASSSARPTPSGWGGVLAEAVEDLVVARGASGELGGSRRSPPHGRHEPGVGLDVDRSRGAVPRKAQGVRHGRYPQVRGGRDEPQRQHQVSRFMGSHPSRDLSRSRSTKSDYAAWCRSVRASPIPGCAVGRLADPADGVGCPRVLQAHRGDVLPAADRGCHVVDVWARG
jgi:hypothetical protein